LLDLVRSLANESGPFTFEIYGNFLLQDVKTKRLSVSHGYRCVSDVSLSAGFRDQSDFSVEVSSSSHLDDLADGLVSSRYLRHFERIFADSSRSIVSLLQVVICCDKLTSRGTWHEPGKIYSPRDK